ncbi:hypothetical protein SRHO_G00192350 [Serrasalmus rhombeus]
MCWIQMKSTNTEDFCIKCLRDSQLRKRPGYRIPGYQDTVLQQEQAAVSRSGTQVNQDRKGQISVLFTEFERMKVMIDLYRGVLPTFQRFVKKLQHEKPMVHLVRVEMVAIVRELLSKFMRPKDIPLSHKEILKVDVRRRDLQLPNKRLSVGQFCYVAMNKARMERKQALKRKWPPKPSSIPVSTLSAQATNSSGQQARTLAKSLSSPAATSTSSGQCGVPSSNVGMSVTGLSVVHRLMVMCGCDRRSAVQCSSVVRTSTEPPQSRSCRTIPRRRIRNSINLTYSPWSSESQTRVAGSPLGSPQGSLLGFQSHLSISN